MIADYGIETFGIEQARRYRAGVEACFQMLADHPNLGRNVEHLAPGLRRFEHQSHIVFYLPNDQGVFIVRVLHQKADYERHF